MGPKHSTSNTVTNNCGNSFNNSSYHCGGRKLDAYDGIRMIDDGSLLPDYFSIKYLDIGQDSFS